MVKLSVALTNNNLPYEKLCRDNLSHFLSMCAVGRGPVFVRFPSITAVHDIAKQLFYCKTINGVVYITIHTFPKTAFIINSEVAV